jgi:DNA modification methylase
MMTLDRVTIGNSVLYCGDCRAVLPGISFDSIVTDPPYGIGKKLSYCRDKRVDWNDTAPDITFLLERQVPTMIFGGNYFPVPPSRKWIVWDKGGCFYGRSFAECELCYCNFDGNAKIIKYDSIFNRGFIRNKSERVHPTQKPTMVMRFCISELPEGSGNVICDPYMGSGTTGVACVQMGRAFIGIEQKREYFESACKRIAMAHVEYEDQFSEVKALDLAGA